ncbi:MAG: oxidoreductase [Acidobacteriota bacterium]
MQRLFLLLLLVLLSVNSARAQWKTEPAGSNSRFRAIAALNSSVAWAGGNNGSYARTTDGGATWKTDIVPDGTNLDFRDVHVVDINTAYLLSVGEGELSRIYKTTDGGKQWKLQFTNTNPKAFFDALAFWDANNGIAISDPVDGHFIIIVTSDGGATWKTLPPENTPPALPGEVAFAASGTCLTVQGQRNVWFGSGGGAARVFRSTDRGQSWKVAETPITSGGDSVGIFSLAFKDAKNGIAVGGDYRKPNEVNNNVARTTDGGQTWITISRAKPAGFRSCVTYVPGAATPTLVAVGPLGSDYSLDNGTTWMLIDTIGFHSVSFAGSVMGGWAVGENGLIAKFVGSLAGLRKPTVTKSK